MTAIERFFYFLDNQGLKHTPIEKELGFSNGYLGKMKSRNASIGSDVIEKIVSYFPDLNVEWLIMGKKPMLKSDVTAYKEENKNMRNSIPLVSQFVAAGFGSSDFNIKESDVKAYYVIPKFKDRRIDFMIEISGSSMYPKYNSGDVIACTIIKESKFIQWNKVHVIATTEQGLLVKRIKENGTDAIMAISDNPDYPPFPIPKDEITGIALVVGVIRLE